MPSVPASTPRPQAHAFCHLCGSAYSSLSWPRSCGSCGGKTYQNPMPVSIAATPVWDDSGFVGFLGIKRGLRDGYGKWAFPGGFTDLNESLEQGAAREQLEETGLPAQHPRLALSLPTPGQQTLVFCLTDPIHFRELSQAKAQDSEILEVGVLRRGQPLAYPLHEQALETLWDQALQLALAARQLDPSKATTPSLAPAARSRTLRG